MPNDLILGNIKINFLALDGKRLLFNNLGFGQQLLDF
jgi:hypothetical protein